MIENILYFYICSIKGECILENLNQILLGDSLELFKLVPNDFIDIIITSPPYNVGKDYGEEYDDEMAFEEYFDFTKAWIKESFRVLKNGGRICINVPMESNKNGKRYVFKDYIDICYETGFITNSMAVWNKTQVTNRCAWGSWLSPSCPNIINPYEVIMIFSKGDRKKKGDKSKIDITRDEFIEYTLGIWTFAPESSKKIGHPAPFPKELPYRCLKLFSYQEDIVLDPFSGSGTTAIVAYELNRRFLAFEKNKDFWLLSKNRFEEETGIKLQ